MYNVERSSFGTRSLKLLLPDERSTNKQELVEQGFPSGSLGTSNKEVIFGYILSHPQNMPDMLRDHSFLIGWDDKHLDRTIGGM